MQAIGWNGGFAKGDQGKLEKRKGKATKGKS
jgi:hypothetical protein